MNKILTGKVLDELRNMDSNNFHGCITDAPYGLGKMEHPDKFLRYWLDGENASVNSGDFMGKDWEFTPGGNLDFLQISSPSISLFFVPEEKHWSITFVLIVCEVTFWFGKIDNR